MPATRPRCRSAPGPAAATWRLLVGSSSLVLLAQLLVVEPVSSLSMADGGGGRRFAPPPPWCSSSSTSARPRPPLPLPLLTGHNWPSCPCPCLTSPSPTPTVRIIRHPTHFRRPRQQFASVASFATSTGGGGGDDVPDGPAVDGRRKRKRVLVVGGNGRVGGSTARHVHILTDGRVEVVLGGRSHRSFEASRDRIYAQLRDASVSVPRRIEFQPLDLDCEDPSELVDAIRESGADAVVHTAGPFQGRTDPTLLRACIQARVACYVDVCDEPPLCEASRSLSSEAEGAGVTAVTAAGIWPGASALMASRAVREVRRHRGDGGRPDGGDDDDDPDPVDVKMSFFTAGTGNAGATIVSATFLLLCQGALTIHNGVEVEKEPWTDPIDVDFRGDQGVKTVRLLDNPDVFTLHRSLRRVNELSSRFATAPPLWNRLFGAMKSLVPREILGNADIMQRLSLFSLPIIRAVDRFVGATNAMRVDAASNTESGASCTFIVTHDDLEQCVGLATAAFVLELLDANDNDDDGTENKIGPGVYYPAELPLTSQERILETVRRDAIVWEFESSTTSSSSSS